MKQLAKRVFGFSVFTSIFFLALGLFLFFRPEGTINLISSLIGILLLINGGITLINYFRNQIYSNYKIELIYGIVIVVSGFALILNPVAIVSILPFILGIYFVISGAFKLKYAFDIKTSRGTMPMFSLLVSILMILCGILFIVNPFGGAIAITQAIGIFMSIYGLLDIVNYFCIRKDIRELERIFRG